MKKIFSIITAAMIGTVASAQETYDNAPLAQKDLNGTARYVGMGGAMEALGADVSTMGTNPAGIGMFRRSVVNGSFGFNSQSEAESFNGADKTNMSFDQAGLSTLCAQAVALSSTSDSAIQRARTSLRFYLLPTNSMVHHRINCRQ